MTRVLFVCLGNICRSPLAEHLFRQLVACEGLAIEVASCGVNPVLDEAPRATREAARALGLDLAAHRSQPATPALLSAYDLVLTMEEAQARHPKLRGHPQVYALWDYATEGRERRDVADPWGQDVAGMRRCAEEIAGLLPAVLERLQRER